jgi:hypothetical protein
MAIDLAPKATQVLAKTTYYMPTPLTINPTQYRTIYLNSWLVVVVAYIFGVNRK